MDFSGYFGNGPLVPVVGLALIAYGLIYYKRRIVWTGVALLLAISAGAIVTEILKHALHLPRPNRDTAGFPSGHANMAFSAAAVLGSAFPQWSPLFYLLAITTGVSRMFFRAHFVRDVVGSAVIGLVIGRFFFKKLVEPLPGRRTGWLRGLVWVGDAVIAAMALVFFLGIEQDFATRIVRDSRTIENSPAVFKIDFGNPKDQSFLGGGWSTRADAVAEKRTSFSTLTAVSSTAVVLPESKDYRILVYLMPVSAKATVCQQLDVTWNGNYLTRLPLENGWHWYGFTVSRALTKTGPNDLGFHYRYAKSFGWSPSAEDNAPRSVAFDRLKIIPSDRSVSIARQF